MKMLNGGEANEGEVKMEREGVNPRTQSHTDTSLRTVGGLPSPPGVLKDKHSFHIFSPLLLTSLRPSLSLLHSPSLSLSRCLARQQRKAADTGRGRGPGAKCWRSPALTGMLTFHPSPPGEAHLFDLRCDCVFSSPHLQLPLDHVLAQSPPSTPLYSGLCTDQLL